MSEKNVFKQNKKEHDENVLKEFFLDFDINSHNVHFESHEFQLKLKKNFAEAVKEFLDLKDDFLNILNLAKNDYYLPKEIYSFRKKIIRIFCYLYFFSDISGECSAEILDYSSVLGKLKDNNFWSSTHEKLLERSNRIFTIVKNANFDSRGSFNKLNLIKHNIMQYMQTSEENFNKHIFHALRKNLRMILFFIKILNNVDANNQKLSENIKKYRKIVSELGQALDYKKTFNWKKMAEKYVY